jgi:hypothetical protein
VAGTGGPTEALEGLDPRSWGRLLAALRARATADMTSEAAWVPLLDRPSSELATGAGRRALSEAVLADTTVCVALAADGGLPEALRAAVVQPMPVASETAGADGADVAHDVAEGATDGDDAGPAGDGSALRGRLRELRRDLDQVRRRRDGAEARALAAEQRATSLTAELAARDERLTVLQRELATTEEATRAAVARAERRSAGRVSELETALAHERREHERLRREAERDRELLEVSRAEVAVLRAEVADHAFAAARHPARAVGATRPVGLPEGLHPDTTESARWLLDRVELVIVDGYNVTKNAFPEHDLETQRRMLLDRLRPLVSQGRGVPLVIFDGDRPRGSSTRAHGLEVRFSGGGVIADDEIVFAVAATAVPVLVVTDDRELRDRVAAQGADVVGALVFLGALDR